MPGLRHNTEPRHAGGHRDAPAGHDDARPEALVEVANGRRQERAAEVIDGDGRRHRRGRPAVQSLERRDVQRETVEAEPEAEQRHDEGRAHDLPAVEESSAHAWARP